MRQARTRLRTEKLFRSRVTQWPVQEGKRHSGDADSRRGLNNVNREEISMRFTLKSVLLAGALASAPFSAVAQETIIMWDFFTGGDGVRMKALLDKFNQEHAGKIAIETTT